MKFLLSSLIKETDSFEVDVKALEENVTTTENVTSELSDLLRETKENLTQAEEALTSAQTKLTEEIWVQLETAITLNRQLQRRVSYHANVIRYALYNVMYCTVDQEISVYPFFA